MVFQVKKFQSKVPRAKTVKYENEGGEIREKVEIYPSQDCW